MNVENRIRGFALRVDNLIPPIIGNGSAPVYFRQKYFGIERELSIAFHSRPSLRTSSSFQERRPFYSIPPRRTIRLPPRRPRIETPATHRLEVRPNLSLSGPPSLA